MEKIYCMTPGSVTGLSDFLGCLEQAKTLCTDKQIVFVDRYLHDVYKDHFNEEVCAFIPSIGTHFSVWDLKSFDCDQKSQVLKLTSRQPIQNVELLFKYKNLFSSKIYKQHDNLKSLLNNNYVSLHARLTDYAGGRTVENFLETDFFPFYNYYKKENIHLLTDSQKLIFECKKYSNIFCFNCIEHIKKSVPEKTSLHNEFSLKYYDINFSEYGKSVILDFLLAIDANYFHRSWGGFSGTIQKIRNLNKLYATSTRTI